jgi:hypothetical protein
MKNELAFLPFRYASTAPFNPGLDRWVWLTSGELVGPPHATPEEAQSGAYDYGYAGTIPATVINLKGTAEAFDHKFLYTELPYWHTVTGYVFLGYVAPDIEVYLKHSQVDGDSEILILDNTTAGSADFRVVVPAGLGIEPYVGVLDLFDDPEWNALLDSHWDWRVAVANGKIEESSRRAIWRYVSALYAGGWNEALGDPDEWAINQAFKLLAASNEPYCTSQAKLGENRT